MVKKEPVKPVVFNFWPVLFMLAIVMVLQSVNIYYILETNSLLFTFQRVDVVKDEPHNPQQGDMLPTVAMPPVRGIPVVEGVDPNICFHWESECEDKNDCKSICHMGKDK